MQKTAPRVVVVMAMLVAMGVIAFAWAPGLRAPYQYDDHVTPVKDPASQSLGAWAAHIPETLRPLTKLTFAVESSVGMTSAPARRVFESVLFLLVVVVLGFLVHAFTATARLRNLHALFAIAAATLFAVHPVHAESVLALAGRSALLSLFFTLASALALVHRRHALTVALAVAAVLARETAIVWLVVVTGLVVAERYRTGDTGAPRARVAVAMITAALIGALVVFTSPRMRALVAFAWSDGSTFDLLGLQWAALPFGIFRFLTAPSSFTVDMEFAPHGAIRFVLIVVTACLYVVLVWLVLRARSRDVRIASAIVLALVVPTHSVFPKLDALTARDVSTSSAAFVCLIAALVGTWRKRTPVQEHTGGARALVVTGALLVALALTSFLVVKTRARAALQQDPIALWRDAARKTATSTRPLKNYGTLCSQHGLLDEAHAAFTEAVRRQPHDFDARERLVAVETLIETRDLLQRPRAPESEQP
jgi:hypothetical protein